MNNIRVMEHPPSGGLQMELEKDGVTYGAVLSTWEALGTKHTAADALKLFKVCPEIAIELMEAAIERGIAKVVLPRG